MAQPGDRNDEALLDFAARLIREPSVLGGEEKVGSLVAEEMRSLGFDRVEVDFLGNVIGIVEGDAPGPFILFDGHMDTVDVIPADSWSFSPFGGHVGSGRIWGRGATDMKGPLAAMVHAVGRLDRSRMAGRAAVCASVGEEQTEGTALEPVLDALDPDFVVIGEPTDLRLATGGRGRAEFEIEVSGIPSHASTPDQGRNAVLEAVRLIQEITGVSLPVHPRVGPGVLCLTGMISEPYPGQSVVPSRCRITYERRLVPGDTLEGAAAEFEDCFRQAGVAAKVKLAEAEVATPTGRVIRSRKWYPPWEIDPGALVVRAAERALESVGLWRGFSAYRFCTNAACTAGTRSLPTIGYGPSRESLAHVVDEYIEIADLLAGRQGYAAIARELLDREERR